MKQGQRRQIGRVGSRPTAAALFARAESRAATVGPRGVRMRGIRIF